MMRMERKLDNSARWLNWQESYFAVCKRQHSKIRSMAYGRRRYIGRCRKVVLASISALALSYWGIAVAYAEQSQLTEVYPVNLQDGVKYEECVGVEGIMEGSVVVDSSYYNLGRINIKRMQK